MHCIMDLQYAVLLLSATLQSNVALISYHSVPRCLTGPSRTKKVFLTRLYEQRNMHAKYSVNIRSRLRRRQSRHHISQKPRASSRSTALRAIQARHWHRRNRIQPGTVRYIGTYNSFLFPKSPGALAVAESPTRAKVVANNISFLIREYKADRDVDRQQRRTDAENNDRAKHSITIVLDNVRSAPNVSSSLFSIFNSQKPHERKSQLFYN